jgi:hypothetical protein
MRRLIVLWISTLIILVMVLQTGCKTQEVALPQTQPRIMQFYFTKKQISVRAGDVTTLIIQCQHTHHLFLNGQEIPLRVTIDYSPQSFDNKPGTYSFTLRAENNNGLSDKKTRRLEVID